MDDMVNLVHRMNMGIFL